MNVFLDRSQLLLIPTIGFVFADDGIYITLAFLCFGLSLRICAYIPDE